MRTLNIANLSELETEIDKLRNDASIVFRGQSNADWGLQTTLERFSQKVYSVTEFNRALLATSVAVNSLIGSQWSLDHQPEINFDRFSAPPNYEFMAHARRLGFPTPVLDWTESLYVALYFAFSDARSDTDVAIFAYIHSISGSSGGLVGAPSISLLGPYLSTHKRHFLQQGRYTVATQKENDLWKYCSHDLVLENSNQSHENIVYKFRLSGSLRIEILRKLQEMNVNAFSLLSDEGSLMKALAFKELTLHEIDRSKELSILMKNVTSKESSQNG